MPSKTTTPPERVRRSAPVLVYPLASRHKMLWLLPGGQVTPDDAGCKVPATIGVNGTALAAAGRMSPHLNAQEDLHAAAPFPSFALAIQRVCRRPDRRLARCRTC